MVMMNRLGAYKLCPFCGKAVLGNPWDVKDHVQKVHGKREKDFILHLSAMIRRWVKT